MKKNTLLIVGGAIVVYYLWKKSQEPTETTSKFSNIGGPYTQDGGGCFCTRNSDGTGTIANCHSCLGAGPHPDGVGLSGGITAPSGGSRLRLRRR